MDGSHSETLWLLLNKVTSDYFPWFAWTELFSFSGSLNHFRMGITLVLHFNMQRRGSQVLSLPAIFIATLLLLSYQRFSARDS